MDHFNGFEQYTSIWASEGSNVTSMTTRSCPFRSSKCFLSLYKDSRSWEGSKRPFEGTFVNFTFEFSLRNLLFRPISPRPKGFRGRTRSFSQEIKKNFKILIFWKILYLPFNFESFAQLVFDILVTKPSAVKKVVALSTVRTLRKIDDVVPALMKMSNSRNFSKSPISRNLSTNSNSGKWKTFLDNAER